MSKLEKNILISAQDNRPMTPICHSTVFRVSFDIAVAAQVSTFVAISFRLHEHILSTAIVHVYVQDVREGLF